MFLRLQETLMLLDGREDARPYRIIYTTRSRAHRKHKSGNTKVRFENINLDKQNVLKKN